MLIRKPKKLERKSVIRRRRINEGITLPSRLVTNLMDALENIEKPVNIPSLKDCLEDLEALRRGQDFDPMVVNELLNNVEELADDAKERVDAAYIEIKDILDSLR